LDVFLGKYYTLRASLQSIYSPYSFGLLHRIPPIPADRQPGALPPELRDSVEFEEQTLFVPADAPPDPLDIEFPSDNHDQPQHFYSPPLSHDYSYTYSNRSAAFAPQSHSSTIPEEYEGTDSHPHSSRSSQDLQYMNDSNHYHHHHGHDHDSDHGNHNHRIRTLPSLHRSSTPRSFVTPDVHTNGDSRS
jgi:hypothetical protein